MLVGAGLAWPVFGFGHGCQKVTMAKRKNRRAQSHAQPQTAPPRSDLQRGVRAFEQGDYGGAVAAFGAAFRRAPTEPLARALAEAHFRRACQTWRKMPAQALEDIKSAVSLAPDDARYLYHRGLMYHRAGQYFDAVRAYRDSLRRDPINYARSAYMLCLALAEMGTDPAADHAWELLTAEQRERIKPSDKAFVAAMVCLSSSRFLAAEPHLQRLVPIFPGLAHYYLGVVAQRRGKSDEAFEHWLAARQAGFSATPLRYNLTVAYVSRAIAHADSPELPSILRAALKLAPDSPILLKLKQRADFLAGVEAANAGDWRTALQRWLAARQGSDSKPGQSGQALPAPRELIANVALACEKLERYGEAADAWREYARRRPRSGENAWSAENAAQLWKHIDTLYARAGRFEQSVTALRYAMKAQPDDLTIRLALAKRHLENQNWRSAQTAAMRVLELAPNHPEGRALYAQIIEASGDLDAMIEAWELVAALPNARYTHMARQRLVKIYAERGDFYCTLDDPRAAADDYARALEITPHDAVLRARYGALLVAESLERARAEFEKVDLSNSEAVFLLVEAWERVGQHEEAMQWLKRANGSGQHDPSLLIELGAALLDTRPDTAKGYFDRALADANGTAGARLLTTIAAQYARRGEGETAYKYARQALTMDADFGPAHLNLGLWDAARGRRPASQTHLQRALTWARTWRRIELAEGIEEAINLIEERYIPTLDEVLDTVDPDGQNEPLRRLMGYLPARGILLP